MNDIIIFYEEKMKELYEISKKANSGGEIRSKSGELSEHMFDMIWKDISKEFDVENKIIKGEVVPIKVKSKSGKFNLDSSVDRHCFIKGKFILAVEAKNYMDKCYFQRASSDFELMKRIDKNIKTIVFAFENAINEETFNFFIDEGYTDKVFYLLDGKRTPTKPIWKYFKKINKKSLEEVYEYIRSIFREQT